MSFPRLSPVSRHLAPQARRQTKALSAADILKDPQNAEQKPLMEGPPVSVDGVEPAGGQ
jgi:hypothetical protein